MHTADIDFFEEYKRLETLCSDMYSCQNGVSEYLTHMESQSHQGRYRVPSWDSDYNKLRRVRQIRNQIAHRSASARISEPDNLDFVQDFYSRIFSGNDPLTLLRKSLESENKARKPQREQAENRIQRLQTQPQENRIPPKPPRDVPEEKESYSRIGILIGVGLFILVLLILFNQ